MGSNKQYFSLYQDCHVLLEEEMEYTVKTTEMLQLADKLVQHIHVYCVVFFFVLLPVSLDCPFFIVPSVFSNIYLFQVHWLESSIKLGGNKHQLHR